MKLRYIGDNRLFVSLPLAFSIEAYRKSPEFDSFKYRCIYNDPFICNEDCLTLKGNHSLIMYWTSTHDIYKFIYLIDGVVIHRYTDEFTFRDNTIHKLVRTVDDRYRYNCWENISSICYQRVPIYKP